MVTSPSDPVHQSSDPISEFNGAGERKDETNAGPANARATMLGSITPTCLSDKAQQAERQQGERQRDTRRRVEQKKTGTQAIGESAATTSTN